MILPADHPEAAERTARALAREGGVALVPTETVYGLVCRWGDAAGVARIYELKDRDRSKPLAMFAGDAAGLEAAGGVVTPVAARLIARFCPGPVTLIVPGRNGGTVGFRSPDHPFIKALLAATGFPLASTSANLSGRPNVRTAALALAMLTGEVDAAVDGGTLPEDALASTVIDATGPAPRILRPGPVSERAILEALGA